MGIRWTVRVDGDRNVPMITLDIEAQRFIVDNAEAWLDRVEETKQRKTPRRYFKDEKQKTDASPSAAWGMRSSIVPRATKRAPTE